MRQTEVFRGSSSYPQAVPFTITIASCTFFKHQVENQRRTNRGSGRYHNLIMRDYLRLVAAPGTQPVLRTDFYFGDCN
jgi:hypothetical protein